MINGLYTALYTVYIRHLFGLSIARHIQLVLYNPLFLLTHQSLPLTQYPPTALLATSTSPCP